MPVRLTLVPALKIQRDLHALPRGMERFHQYVQTMTGGTDEVVLPLMAMNPMGKPHVAELLDGLLALEAEAIAEQALREASARLAQASLEARVVLVVSDDLHGGWTHRSTSEASHLFEHEAEHKRGWLTVVLWTSEPPSAARVRTEVLASAYRRVHVLTHGEPRTLGERMRQEGRARRFADEKPALDPQELQYTHQVLSPHRESTHYPTVLACLYGDAAAKQLGYEPLGLASRAGFELAIEEAWREAPPAERAGAV